jgi:predicted aldo/keto reductase-like oxidoreductase
MSISRRQFLEASAFSSLLAPAVAANGMPTRVLGKTGARVSLLAFGGGSRFLAYKTPDKAALAVEKALAAGINYFDSAYGYGNGQSETWLGEMLQAKRKDCFLVTKIDARDYDKAWTLIEGALKRLRTDQVDLMHVHSLAEANDLEAVEKGVLKALQKAKEQKLTRFIGVTCHTNPVILKQALERHEFDCTQMALNAARIGNVKGRPRSFEEIALPVALKKGMGVTAMKIFGQEKLLNTTSIQNLVRYSMSLPVAATVIGMPQLEHIDANVAIAKNFQPMKSDEMKKLYESLPGEAVWAMNQFFADHRDC